MTSEFQWYRVENDSGLFSPSLIIYPDRIESNIRRMISISGDVSRLRPHVKTHKMREVVRLQMKYGITRFKCATISEAEMVASCGAPDILLAIQPVGPNMERFFRLKSAYTDIKISCIADTERSIEELSGMAVRFGIKTPVWLDINAGMNRTGVVPGERAVRCYKLIHSLPQLEAAGLSVYDGHIHEKAPDLRRTICEEAYAPIEKMIGELNSIGLGPVNVVAGGTPTFPIHAARKDVELSPGTVLLWDWGYSTAFKDLDFQHAAVLLTRVISKPAEDLLCLDLGHKAVGSEMPQPRVSFPGLNDYTITGHNEEHMVIRTSMAKKFQPGDLLYAIPWHICPTVDRYDMVYVAEKQIVTGQWEVAARKRQIIF